MGSPRQKKVPLSDLDVNSLFGIDWGRNISNSFNEGNYKPHYVPKYANNDCKGTPSKIPIKLPRIVQILNEEGNLGLDSINKRGMSVNSHSRLQTSTNLSERTNYLTCDTHMVDDI